MKNRGTYALLVLFFAGLGGLWLADYSRLPTRRDRDRQRGRILVELMDAKPEELRKVEILGGPEPMVFERRDGNRWQMTAPMDVAADPSKLETLAYNLKELSRRPEADTLEGDLASFGLAPPERTIRLWGEKTDAPLATLELGKVSLDRRFVRAGGSEGVEVVDARGLDLVKLPPVRWRDHEMFRVPSFEVDAVRLAARGSELKLRRDRDSWRIVAPIKALAAEPRVDGLIADLGTLRVTDDSRFVANDVPAANLARYGLNPPFLTIEVDAVRGDRRRPRQSIDVGRPVDRKDGQLYARRGDQDDVVALDSRVLRNLGVDPNAFRSPKVADINPARVVRIAAEAEPTGFEVVRNGREWTMVRPSPASAERPAIESFLKSLAELQMGNYPTPATPAEAGLDRPSLTLKVWQAPDPRAPEGSVGTEVEPALSLRIGRRDAAKRVIYAQVEGDRTILALPDSANDFLPRTPLAFRNRLILAMTPDRIERLAVATPSRKVTLQAPILKVDPLANAPIGWWMVEPVEAPADAPAVGRILALLGALRAEALVADKPDDLKPYGLDAPTATLAWSTLPGDSMLPEPPKAGPADQGTPLETRSLRIGAPVPGKPGHRFASLSYRPLVFTIGPEALGQVDAEFHDRRVLRFDPARVKRVHLAWPDRGFSLTSAEKDGRLEWSVEGAVDAPGFDPGRVGPLLKAASDLSTPRFLQYRGDFPAGAGLAPPRVAIRFEFDDATPPQEIRIGAPAANGQALATTSDAAQGPVFLLPGGPFAGLTRPPRQHDDLPDDVFAP